MKLNKHVVASSIFSGILYTLTKSMPLALTSFFVGFLIDLDHLLDYWREYPFSLNIKHFFYICEETKFKKIYLLLHSIELMIILGIVSFLTRNIWITGISIGIAQHLLFDQLSNPIKAKSYLLYYRWINDFDAQNTLDFSNKKENIL